LFTFFIGYWFKARFSNHDKSGFSIIFSLISIAVYMHKTGCLFDSAESIILHIMSFSLFIFYSFLFSLSFFSQLYLSFLVKWNINENIKPLDIMAEKLIYVDIVEAARRISQLLRNCED